MTIQVRLDRRPHGSRMVVSCLEEGFTGILSLPLSAHDTALATETVYSPTAEIIHEVQFPVSFLGDHTTDIAPYVIGMTRSAIRRAA